MEKKTVVPAGYPTWVTKMGSPFSPAVRAGSFVFLSGYPRFKSRDTGDEVLGIEAQTRETLEVIKDTLEAAGSSLERVVKVTVFLRNTADFAKMNEVYQTYFEKDPPARSTIITGLQPPSALIEIECIAIV